MLKQNEKPNFLAGDKVAEEFMRLAKQSKSLDLAVAYWGTGATDRLGLLTPAMEKMPSRRVICNLKCGATNPEEIKKLQKHGCDVRYLDDLHAKVYLTDSGVIIGSSNASTNGLAQEEDEKCLREGNVLLIDQDFIGNIMEPWFNEQWKDAKEIKENDLSEAQRRYDEARSSRPVIEKMSLIDVVTKFPNRLRGRNIWFVADEWHGETTLGAVNDVKKKVGGDWEKEYVIYEYGDIALKSKNGSLVIDFNLNKIEADPAAGLHFYEKCETVKNDAVYYSRWKIIQDKEVEKHFLYGYTKEDEVRFMKMIEKEKFSKPLCEWISLCKFGEEYKKLK